MRYAINDSGQEVDAHEVSSRRGRYTCPNCGHPVRFRGGVEREPHFSHIESADDTKECEDYHPSNGAIANQNFRSLIRAGVHLYVKLTELPSGSFSWELQLRLPQAADSAGSIGFYSGYGNQEVPLSSLMLRPLFFPVRPGIQQYRFSPRGVADKFFLSKIAAPCTGLGGAMVHLFKFSIGPGRQLTDREPVFWGRRYIMLTEFSLDRYLPDFLRRVSLQPNSGSFSATIVEIPPIHDISIQQRFQVSKFAIDVLKKNLTVPPPKLVLLTPALSYDESDDCYVIDETAKLFLGIVGERGSDQIAQVSLHNETGRRVYTHPIHSRAPLTFTEDLELPAYEFSISNSQFESLLIRRQKPQLIHPAAETSFVFSPPGSRLEERHSCDSPNLKRKFEDVAAGVLTLSSIVGTDGTPIEMLSGTSLSSLSKIQRFILCEDLNWKGSDWLTGPDLARRVQQVLRSVGAVELRIANFSSVAVGPDGRTTLSAFSNRSQFSSYRQLQGHITWLLARSGVEVSDRLEGEDVFTRFCRVPTWPAHLRPRVNLVKRKLSRIRPELFVLNQGGI